MEQGRPPLAERAAARRTLAQFARALRLESHTLAAHPDLTWQQLTNRLQWAPVPAALVDAATMPQSGSGHAAALRVRTRPRESEALLRRLDHGSDWLVACAFVPKSGLLVSACADRTLRLWDIATGRPVRVLAGMPAAPLSCAATGDGRHVVATTGNPAGTVHVWEVRAGRQVATAIAHEPACTACAVRADGSATFTLLTFGTDGRIRLWTLPDLRPMGGFEPPSEPLTCGTVSPDGSVLAYGGRQGVLHVRRLPAGGSVTDLVHGAGVPLSGCAAGARGSPIVTSGADGRVVLWDLPTGRSADLPSAAAPTVHCALADDGSLLATATDDGRIELWELPGVRRLGVLDAHTAMAVGCALSPTADTVASVSGDGTVCLWDVGAASGSVVGGHAGLVEQCAFVSGGSALVTASVDGTARRWETATGRESGAPVTHPGQTVLLLPRGDDLVLAAGDHGALLQVVGLVAEASYRLEGSERTREPVRIGEHGAQVWGLAALPRDSVVTAGRDGVCRVWDVAQRVERLAYPGDRTPVRALATALDGTFVASAGESGRLHIWDPLTGASLPGTGWQAVGVRTVAVGADGAVVVGGVDGTVSLGGADSTRMPRTIGRHDGSQVSAARWIAGSSVATCAVDGTLALWSAEQGAGGWHRQWYRQAHRGPVSCLAASPSGTVLLTGGADGGVKLWESATGMPLASLPCPGRVHHAALHPRDPVIAAVGDGGLVCIAAAIGLETAW
jgi:NACHT domain- and WD repeat-containing protein